MVNQESSGDLRNNEIPPKDNILESRKKYLIEKAKPLFSNLLSQSDLTPIMLDLCSMLIRSYPYPVNTQTILESLNTTSKEINSVHLAVSRINSRLTKANIPLRIILGGQDAGYSFATLDEQGNTEKSWWTELSRNQAKLLQELVMNKNGVSRETVFKFSMDKETPDYISSEQDKNLIFLSISRLKKKLNEINLGNIKRKDDNSGYLFVPNDPDLSATILKDLYQITGTTNTGESANSPKAGEIVADLREDEKAQLLDLCKENLSEHLIMSLLTMKYPEPLLQTDVPQTIPRLTLYYLKDRINSKIRDQKLPFTIVSLKKLGYKLIRTNANNSPHT